MWRRLLPGESQSGSGWCPQGAAGRESSKLPSPGSNRAGLPQLKPAAPSEASSAVPSGCWLFPLNFQASSLILTGLRVFRIRNCMITPAWKGDKAASRTYLDLQRGTYWQRQIRAVHLTSVYWYFDGSRLLRSKAIPLCLVRLERILYLRIFVNLSIS